MISNGGELTMASSQMFGIRPPSTYVKEHLSTDSYMIRDGMEEIEPRLIVPPNG